MKPLVRGSSGAVARHSVPGCGALRTVPPVELPSGPPDPAPAELSGGVAPSTLVNARKSLRSAGH